MKLDREAVRLSAFTTLVGFDLFVGVDGCYDRNTDKQVRLEYFQRLCKLAFDMKDVNEGSLFDVLIEQDDEDVTNLLRRVIKYYKEIAVMEPVARAAENKEKKRIRDVVRHALAGVSGGETKLNNEEVVRHLENEGIVFRVGGQVVVTRQGFNSAKVTSAHTNVHGPDPRAKLQPSTPTRKNKRREGKGAKTKTRCMA
jgi:hypothetical protein